jgi:hypothetical protein
MRRRSSSVWRAARVLEAQQLYNLPDGAVRTHGLDRNLKEAERGAIESSFR